MHTHKKLAVAMLLGLSTAAVQAHDAWVAFDSGAYRIVFGHPGKTQNFDPTKIKSVAVLDSKGAALTARKSVMQDGVVLSPADHPGKLVVPGITTVVFDNGFWTKTSDTEKSVNESKSKHPEYLEAFHSMKFGKSLFGWSEAAGQPQGLEFEIVPLANPYTLKDGDAFPVQVLYQGKPLADAVVGYGGHKDVNKVKTDAEGRANVPFRHNDMLVAGHRVPLLDSPDADAMTMGANLYLAAP